MMNFQKSIKPAFSAEQIKVKNKHFIIISLVIQLLFTLIIFISTESYNKITNILFGNSVLNDYFISQLQIYLIVAQPLLLIFFCYILFNQIEFKNGKSILNNSILPTKFINYSKILSVIKYLYFNILLLIGFLLFIVFYIQINNDFVFKINLEMIPKNLFTFLIIPLFALPIIAILNLISRSKSSFYVLFLFVLPFYYFVNANITIYLDKVFYYYFNLQIVVLKMLEIVIQFDNLTLFWIFIVNFVVTFVTFYFINLLNNRSNL